MQNNDLKITEGAEAGTWIKSRLGGEIGSVTDLVPREFEAYCRIFHPASDKEGNQVRWAEVAKACGTTPHGEMQWHAILGQSDPGDLRSLLDVKWLSSSPSIGAMDCETFRALCEILGAYTADALHCFFGLPIIQGWDDFFTRDELRSSLLKLPLGRDYIILSGPLSSIDRSAGEPELSREFNLAS